MRVTKVSIFSIMFFHSFYYAQISITSTRRESVNLENRFTGWHDVNLTEQESIEGKEAGRLLKDEGFEFDIAYTSVLTRAIRTLWLALTEMEQVWIPVHREWRLNERHYGSLQGLNKAETAEKHGDEQVLVWRRSYDIPPPPMSKDDDGYAGKDRRYKNLSQNDIPLSECLKDTVDRFLPLWENTIAPQIKSGKQILIAAHGNSLRALIKYLDDVSDEDILSMNVPTGMPLVYELDENLKPLSRQYLGDPEKSGQSNGSGGKSGKSKVGVYSIPDLHPLNFEQNFILWKRSLILLIN